MFTAIFQHQVGYLAACTLTALILGGAAWVLVRRLGNPHGVWWAGLAFTLTGVLGVTFMDSGRASGVCVLNHQFAEPFHTTQGLWNLAMMVPVGILALMAVRRPLPVLVGVVVLPLGIEFTQATADGLGRVCDSSDAEMNIIGGLVGLGVAATVLTVRRSFDWRAGLKGALIASAAFLLLGAGVARPMLDFTNVDGTGLSDADSDQKRAVETAVKEAFGDHYEIGQLYEQPCGDLPCKNIIFNLHSREKGHGEAFGNGSLSWPDKQHLNVLLEDSDRPTIMGYPVTGAKAPSTDQEANRVAQSYTRQQYPWAKGANVQQTYPVGEKAQLGWITNWRWTHSGVLMPRMLDVQVDRAGHVSQIDVTLGPTRVNLPKAKLDAKQAENAVVKAVAARLRANGSADATFQVKAFTVKAVDQDGKWAPHWLVNVTEDTKEQGDGAQPSNPGETYRVNAITGQVYDSGGASMKVR
ncbi:VanZ family protein [Streptomyces mirabilis]|uniref:VanZ family protein n=1 Tax=Streptomyces mirabilis TaxID=68239 RepID=UPI0033E99182